jgi:hypothetical protein
MKGAAKILSKAKKRLKIVTMACLVVICGMILNSCMVYFGKNPELHVVAINSILGIADFRFDKIEILEKDGYGRTLFSYSNHGSEQYINALVICQRNDKKYSYFYTDYNFVFTDTFILSEEWSEIKEGDLSEKIEFLKERNDWGEEIKEELLMKASIRKIRQEPIPSNKARNAFERSTGYNAWSLVYLTEDVYGRCIGYIWGNDKNGDSDRYYAIIISKNGYYDKENFLMEIEDMFDYQDQMKEFKERNRWNQPL